MPGEIALRNAEHNAVALSEPTFNYSGSGRPNSSDKSPKGKTGAFLSGKKRGLATALIIAFLGIGGAFLTNMSTILPGTLVNNLTIQTDYQQTPSVINISRLISNMTSGRNYDDNTGNKSWTKKYGELTDWLKNRLNKNNIETNGNTISWDGQNASGSNFTNLYNNNAEFRSDITDATFGRAANYYDTPAETTFTNLGGRNVLANYKSTGDSDADMAQLREISAKRLENQTTNSNNTRTEPVYEEDEDGNKTIIGYKAQDADVASSSVSNKSTAEALTAAGGYINKLSENVSSYINWGCTALNTGNTIASIIAGMKLYSTVKNFLTIMESPSKVIAGDGQTSGFNELANEMTKKYTTKVEDLRPSSLSYEKSGDIFSTEQNANVNITTGEVTLEGSMLESPNLRSGLSFGNFDSQTASLFSIIGAGTALGSALSKFGVTNSYCIKAQAAASATSLIGHAAIAIGAAAGGPITIGAAAIGSFVKNKILNFFIGSAINFTISAFLGFLIPTLADALFRNPVENTFGVAAGEWIMSGAGAFGSMAGRQNSGLMPTNKETALAYSRINSQVLAMEAEVDRLNRSPFDISSPNTFLGSLVHKFILPITTSSNKISPVNTIMSLTSSSIASLMGSVSADGEGTQYMTTFGYCPQLEEIGLTGDIYCNPIVTGSVESAQTSLFYNNEVAANGRYSVNNSTYVDTISKNLENCKEDGSGCTIKKGSTLYKYVHYCMKRTSPFGILDANIVSDMQDRGAIANASTTITSILDVKDGFNAEEIRMWGMGDACGNTPNNPYREENLMNAEFVSTQRSLDQFHAYGEEKSAITLLTEEIDAKQAKEASSLEGYIALISGVAKEDVEKAIDIAIYYDYLQNYDPETRIAMSGKTANLKLGSEVLSEIKSEHIYFENEDYITTETPVIAKAFFYTDIYADLRNRSHIA